MNIGVGLRKFAGSFNSYLFSHQIDQYIFLTQRLTNNTRFNSKLEIQLPGPNLSQGLHGVEPC